MDLSAITAALAETGTGVRGAASDAAQIITLRHQLTERDRLLTAAQAHVAELEAALAGLERERSELSNRLDRIAQLATATTTPAPAASSALASAGASTHGPNTIPGNPAVRRPGEARSAEHRSLVKPPDRTAVVAPVAAGELHPAARKLLAPLAQHAPARFTWGQAAMLAGLKPSGGHYNAGRKQLRDLDLVDEAGRPGRGQRRRPGRRWHGAARAVHPGRATITVVRPPAEPRPEMLRALAVRGERYTEAVDLAETLGKKPTGGHWNGGLALLRNNGLVEVDGKRLRASTLFR